MKNHPRAAGLGAFVLCAFFFTGCRTAAPRTFAARQGDEIIVAGQWFHTGTRIITWMDPGGYDANRLDPLAETGPKQTEEATKKPSLPGRYGPRGKQSWISSSCTTMDAASASYALMCCATVTD